MINMGIGRDVKNLDDITEEEAKGYLNEVLISNLPEPLTFASFNFFWQDIPLFLRAQLVRSHIGWSFAERSLRFYDANLNNPVDDYSWDAMPSLTDDPTKEEPPFFGTSTKKVMKMEMERQMKLYTDLLKAGADQQEARNVIGVWFPTDMQTTCTYFALRKLIGKRISSQAHPLWQSAAQQIKALVTEVSPMLGEALIDECLMYGKCLWNSRLDRDCGDCISRGAKKSHEHEWTQTTTFGEKTQCSCGILKPLGLIEEKK